MRELRHAGHHARPGHPPQVENRESQIEGLGEEIDSKWRVMLFACRDRLKDRLYGTWWVFPSFATVLDFLDKDVETFETWVQCAYEVSIIAQDARQHRSSRVSADRAAMDQGRMRESHATNRNGLHGGRRSPGDAQCQPRSAAFAIRSDGAATHA
jgi:hypothetical protein